MMIGSWAERAEGMRGRISDELLRCLETRPLEQVTLQDVARGCGISAPALYRYFRTREELISACAEYAMHTFENLVQRELAKHDRGRARHRAVWRLMNLATQKGPALTRIFDALPIAQRTRLFTSIAGALLPEDVGDSVRAFAAVVLRAFFWEAVHSGGASPMIEEASWRALEQR